MRKILLSSLGILAFIGTPALSKPNIEEIQAYADNEYTSNSDKNIKASSNRLISSDSKLSLNLREFAKENQCGSNKLEGPVSRLEAANVFLNCIGTTTKFSLKAKQLLVELSPDIAYLNSLGSSSVSEGNTENLEAAQFSSTTTIKGKTTFVIGAVDASSSSDTLENYYKKNSGSTTFNYDTEIDLKTSFSGKDLLFAKIRAGNYSTSSLATGLTTLENAFGSNGDLYLDEIWYKFNINNNSSLIVGPRVHQYETLAVFPSVYESILDVFDSAGAAGTYNKAIGAGAGIIWKKGLFGASASYISLNGDNSNPGGGESGCTLAGGIANDCSASNATVQISMADQNKGLAIAYNYASSDNGAGVWYNNATPLTVNLSSMGTTNSISISGWWQPIDMEKTYIPDISFGWGLNSIDINNSNSFDSAVSQSWYLAATWDNVLSDSGKLGMAIGQPTLITSVDTKGISDFVADGQYAFEAWYKYDINNSISITPAVFYLSRPMGDITSPGETYKNYGAVLKSTFKY